MSQMLQVSHVGFSDESHWNTGRFRSLGLVTTSVGCLNTLELELRSLLNESGVSEFKWKHLDGAKERFAAEKLCKFAVVRACSAQLRVDVLSWDIEDSRHKVEKRDDTANLQRMYYHLFRNVLQRRWPDNAVWRLHPDEHTAMEWDTVQDYLENVSASAEIEHSLFTGGRFRFRLRQEFAIEEIQPLSSTDHPLIQLADLFAGLAVFSRQNYEEYEQWETNKAPQMCFFDDDKSMPNPSRSSQERLPLLSKFDKLCKERRLGVSLRTKRGLWTPQPEDPLNFWVYEPQRQEDKAPQR